MAFGDPFSLTVDSVEHLLPLINRGDLQATYSDADGIWEVFISHQNAKGGRIRSLFRVNQKAVVTNPLDQSMDYDLLSLQFVIDRPAFGFTMTQVEKLVAGFKLALSTTTVDKLYGRES